MAKIRIDLRNIEEKPGWMIGLGAGATFLVLGVYLLFSSLFTPKAVAEAPTQTPTPSPTATFTPTPPPTSTPTPTATPVPVRSFLWMPDNTGTYLHRQPGGEILAQVPNGTELALIGDPESMGGMSWQEIEYDDQFGWVLAEAVHAIEGQPGYIISAQEGAFLRQKPQGTVITWLSNGVPVAKVLEQDQQAAMTWRRVEMLDGQTGWVADFLLKQKGGD